MMMIIGFYSYVFFTLSLCLDLTYSGRKMSQQTFTDLAEMDKLK